MIRRVSLRVFVVVGRLARFNRSKQRGLARAGQANQTGPTWVLARSRSNRASEPAVIQPRLVVRSAAWSQGSPTGPGQGGRPDYVKEPNRRG